MPTPDKILANDPRYAELVKRGFNKRFASKPDYIRLVRSTADVIDAVQEAVREKLRVVARSGGHCLDGFVDDPAVRVIVDTSLMTGVSYDSSMEAIVIDAGTTLGEAWRRLFLGWGVTLPAGEVPTLGVGGHVLGGAFGFLCRKHGLAVDYLHGLEVVVVDEKGAARSVVATRDNEHRDLWWGHTGGGGGNFGVVTKYWFRSLPKAPESILTFRVDWKWADVDETAFKRLLDNIGTWCEASSGPDSPLIDVFSSFLLGRKQAGALAMKGLVTADADADMLCEQHIAAVTKGFDVPHERRLERSSWLAFALNPFPELFGLPGGARMKLKDGLTRRRFTDRQLDVVYDYLTRTDHDVPGGMLGLATYGGKVNAVASDATAAVHRDAILTSACTAGWMDRKDDDSTLAWMRAFYRDLFADAGGVPRGALINHPDADLADPELNTSGVPWHTIYYGDNYSRLQRVKANYDPLNIFHHALSIKAPSG